MKIIPVTEAIAKLKDHRANGNGRVFSVEFARRKDGTIKVANARFHVTSHLKGGKLAFKPEGKGLMGYFDVNAGDYRFINLAGIRAVQIDGERFQVA
jgi:hypothetical protein